MMEGIRLYLQQLAVICTKEILAIWQDKATRLIILVPCIILGFLFGYAANYNLEDAPYAVLDLSHSRESADILAAIDGTSFFKRTVTLQNANQIEKYIDRGDVIMALSIPPDFARKLQKGEPASIQVITDGRNTVIAGQAASDVSRIVNQYNLARTGTKSPVNLKIRTWFNPNQITRWFFLPGIIGLLSFSPGLPAGRALGRPGTGGRDFRADPCGTRLGIDHPPRQSGPARHRRADPVHDAASDQPALVPGSLCRILS